MEWEQGKHVEINECSALTGCHTRTIPFAASELVLFYLLMEVSNLAHFYLCGTLICYFNITLSGKIRIVYIALPFFRNKRIKFFVSVQLAYEALAICYVRKSINFMNFTVYVQICPSLKPNNISYRFSFKILNKTAVSVPSCQIAPLSRTPTDSSCLTIGSRIWLVFTLTS